MAGHRPDPRAGWLASAVLLGAVALFGMPAVGASTARFPPAASGTSTAVARVTGEVTIRHRGPGLPSVVTVRLDPPGATGDGELLLSIFQRDGTVINRHVLQPIGRGVYRAEFVFPSGGSWGYYMRFGPGQAGYASGGIVDLTPEAGTVDTFGAVFRSGLRRAPRYVQPLGYAAFGLMAALALAGVWAILAWLRTADD